MAHAHSWTYFYVPGDAFRYCSCGARESVDPDGKSRPVTAKERGFVEGRIKKLEKKGNNLYWQMAYGVLEKRAASTSWLVPAGAAVGAGVQYLRYRDEDEAKLHKHMMRGALLGGLGGAAVMGGVDGRIDSRNRKEQEVLRAQRAATQAQALTEANAVIAARRQALQAEHARRQATLPSNQAEFDAMMADPNHVFEF